MRLIDRLRFFLSRLKSKANAVITAVHHSHRDLAGLSLQKALGHLQHDTLDVQVELTYRKRRYAGERRNASLSVDSSGGVTASLASTTSTSPTSQPERLPAEDVQATYALRWQIELLFKELKAYYRLEQMPSRKREIVESLLFAAILSLAASRRLLQALRQALPAQAQRVKEHRFAALLALLADDLLTLVLHRNRFTQHLQQRLCKLLFVEALDPNKSDLAYCKRLNTRPIRAALRLNPSRMLAYLT